MKKFAKFMAIEFSAWSAVSSAEEAGRSSRVTLRRFAGGALLLGLASYTVYK